MAQDTPPEVGTVLDGYRFKGGDPAQESSWEQVAPIAAPEYGQGAQRLPNGAIVRYGPRGGMDVIVSAAQAASQTAGDGVDSVGKLTEGQGKAMLYGSMMSGAERDYQAARANGYDPAGLRNQAANIAGLFPFDGDYFGRLIRDDQSDAGRQAELRWAEANLRQLTGAAATNPEIARVAAINFDRGNDELANQRYRTRAETFKGTRYAAGPGAAQLGEYPGAPDNPASAAITAGAVGGGVGGIAPGSYQANDQLRGMDRDGDGTVSAEELTAAGLTFQDGAWRQGVAPPPEDVDPSGPGGFADQRTDQGEGAIRKVDAAGRGAADFLTFGFADEIAAGLNTVLPLDRGSRSIWTDTAGDAFRHNLDMQRGIDQADQRDVPVSRATGQVAGGAIALPRAVAKVGLGGVSGAIEQGVARMGAPRIVQQAASGAAAGTAYGGAYGFGAGEGNALERVDDAGRGAVVGGAFGAGAPVAVNALRPLAQPVVGAVQAGNRALARPVVNALGDRASAGLREMVAPRPLESGMSRFASRSPQQANAMSGAQARFEADDIAPAFVDVINDGGRGTLRALATRQTPARQTAREFADGRAAGLQDRVSHQARRTISDDPRSPMEMRSEITGRRNAAADRDFGAVRQEMVQPEPAVIEALRAPALKPAIEEAATAALNRGDSETANMLRQLTEGALDNPNGVQLTVGMADRLARSLNGRAEAFQRSGNNDAASSYFALAERLRGTARQQVGGYDDALRAYAQDSGLASATELGEKFMTMEADEFAAAVGRLSPEERTIAQAAARRAVERAAGTQGGAPGVAQRLSNGREQGARTGALIDDASSVQSGMGSELQALRNAQAVNPGQGSPTSMNAQDAAGAAGMTIDAVTSPLRTAVRAVANRIKSRGFSDAEAEAIVTAATDPARTAELTNMLAQRMSRREARNLARTIRHQATIGLQSDPQR